METIRRKLARYLYDLFHSNNRLYGFTLIVDSTRLQINTIYFAFARTT